MSTEPPEEDDDGDVLPREVLTWVTPVLPWLSLALALAFALGALKAQQEEKHTSTLVFGGMALLAGVLPKVVAQRQTSTKTRQILFLTLIHALATLGLFVGGPQVGTGAGIVGVAMTTLILAGRRGAAISMVYWAGALVAASSLYVLGVSALPWASSPAGDVDVLARTCFVAVTLVFANGMAWDGMSARLERAFVDAREAWFEREDEAEAQRATRRALEHTTRDDALGRLAGGVAHDINNALAVIVTNAQLLKTVNPDATVDPILDAARRAATSSRSLLAVGREGTPGVEEADAAEVLRRVFHLLEHLLSRRIALHVLPETGRPLLRIDAVFLQRALVSICLEGLAVVEGDGTLEIGVGARADGSPCVEFRLCRRNRGGGALHAPRDNPVYDAIVSGLSVRNVSLGWRATTDGATVVLGVPPLRSGLVRSEPSGRPVARPPDRTLHILLVDDEMGVRRALARVLAAAGYRVSQAHNGESAAKVFNGTEAIDLLFTDAVMPETDTGAMIRDFTVHHPHTPVVVCSGYVRAELVLNGISDGAYEFIAKPCAPDRLIKRVEQIIRRSKEVSFAG